MSTNSHAYILSGGKSSRMGKDKGMLELDNKSFISCIAEQLRHVTDQVYLISDHISHDVFEIPRISDAVKGIGPLGGIYTALIHSEVEKNIIVSCDTPFVRKEMFDYLLKKHENIDVSVVSSQDKIHPLIGVYSKNCNKPIEQAIHSGQFKLMSLLDQLNCQIITIDKQSWFEIDLTKNINTPTQYKEIREIWK